MGKMKQYWLIIIAVIAIAAFTIWMADNDIRRFREDGVAGGVRFTEMKNEHGAHVEMTETGDQKVDDYLRKQDALMADMMTKMESVGDSGNASIDFMAGMIPHHESAIAMAELYLASDGDHSSLKNIARNIASTQEKEIAQMEAKIRQLKNDGNKDTAKAEAYHKDYRTMLAGHHTGHNFSVNSVDDAFAGGMIMHHQMAVDMAKGILDYTDDEEVKEMARTMIAAQEQEIHQMREVLKAN